MATTTSNYSFILPAVNDPTDQDLWGGYLNENFTAIDTQLASLAGGASPIPVGAGSDYWGTTAPSGWVFAYGQALSRTTYSALFSVMGTTHGAGDGSTTFNIPDKRGRSSFGKDDMGGTSANRITNQTGGWDGDTLGAAGGSETHQLTQAQLPAYSITFNKQFGSATTGATSIIITGNTVNGSGSINSGGSDSPHNNLPPGISVPYIIYTGVV